MRSMRPALPFGLQRRQIPAIALGLLSGCWIVPAFAQGPSGQNDLAGWTEVLAKANCPAPAGDGPWPIDEVLSLAFALGQASIADVSRRSDPAMGEHLLQGGRIEELEQPQDIADLLLSVTGEAFARAQLLADQPQFCSLAQVLGRDPMYERGEREDYAQPDHYGPDLRLAQIYLKARGCDLPEVNGIFSEADRLQWNQVTPAGQHLPPGAVPDPEQLLALFALPAGLGCAAGAPIPLGAPAALGPALLAFSNACYRTGTFSTSVGLEPFWVSAARFDADRHLPGLAGAAIDLCETAYMEDPDHEVALLAIGALRAADIDPYDAAHLALTIAYAFADLAEYEAFLDTNFAAGAMHSGDAFIAPAEELLQDPASRALGAGLLLALIETADVSSDLGSYGGLPDRLDLLLANGSLTKAEIDLLTRALLESDQALSQPGLLAARIDAVIAGAPGGADLARLAAEMLSQHVAEAWVSEAEESRGVLGDNAYSGALLIDAQTTLPGLAPLMNLSRLLAARPELLADVQQGASGPAQFMLASALLEGFPGQSRSAALTETARGLMQGAADSGLSMAQLRLAQMVEAGLGGPKDPDAALSLYRSAAKGGQPEAYLSLARAAEAANDRGAAVDAYAHAYGLRGAKPITPQDIRQLVAQLQSGRGIWADPLAQALEAEAFQRFWDLIDPGLSTPGSVAGDTHQIATALLSRQSGAAADPARALDWLRLGLHIAEYSDPGTSDWNFLQIVAAWDLHDAILRLKPELAARPMPLDLTLPVWPTNLRPRDMADQVDTSWRKCDTLEPYDLMDCVGSFVQRAMGGGRDDQLAPALDWLRQRAADEAARVEALGYLPATEYPPHRPVPAYASAGLALVLAWWGDWAGAQAAVAPFAHLPFDDFATPRDDQFRRLLARGLKGRAPLHWDQFLDTLQAFASRGDGRSQDALMLIGADAGALPDLAMDLASARDAFAITEPLGLQSRGMAFAARQLAPLEAKAGQQTRAVELELMALNSDLAGADIDTLLHGEIPGDLTRICAWSQGSERLLALGEAQMALGLAELAVNRLQVLRARLQSVPENLQLCFRDQVSDHYRWLAELYLTANRPADADRVLMLLKDFETFSFISRDPKFLPRAAAPLAPSQDAPQIIDSLALVAPTVTAQSIRRRELLLAKKAAPLTLDQETELGTLNLSLAAEASAREAQIAQIVSEVSAAGQRAEAQALESGKTIKRLLRELGNDAAALQYVLLDGRIGIILTTPVSQQIFLVDQLNGQSLSGDLVAQTVAAFRRQLTDRGSDPMPLAQDLAALLLPNDLRAELEAAGTKRLILSLDGVLRYIPFAALHDGELWLVQRYSLSHVTGGAPSKSSAEVVELVAFGVTEALNDMSALPGVAHELAGISGPEGAALQATVRLNDAFTRDSLSAR